jgi:hypothetical protein
LQINVDYCILLLNIASYYGVLSENANASTIPDAGPGVGVCDSIGFICELRLSLETRAIFWRMKQTSQLLDSSEVDRPYKQHCSF